MKNVNVWQAAQKTEGRAGGLHKKSGGLRKRAGWAAEKGSPPAHLFTQPSLLCSRQPVLMCSPLACPVVQLAGPPFCAAHQPAENSCISFSNTAFQPARRPSI